MATEQELMQALRRADAAGDVPAAQAIARRIKETRGAMQVEVVAPEPPQSRNMAVELASIASQVNPLTALVSPPANGFMAQAQQGLTMGWGDEINAARAGLGAILPGGQSPGEAYDTSMTAQQAEREQYQKSNPGRALVGQLAGGLAGAGKVGGAITAGKTAAQALPRIAGAGAISGAFAGAGSADPEDRGSGAITGGLIGAAAGPALMGAARVAKDGYRLVRNATGLNAGAADEAVVGALGRDGRTVADMRQALADAPQGVPVAAADVASPGVQSLLSGAAVQPGKAQQVVIESMEKRLGEQGQRVREAVQQSAGSRQYALSLMEEIKGSRMQRAAPFYKEAFEAGRIDDKRIAEILKDPDVASAYKVAQKIAARESVQLAPLDAPDVRTLDYLKRGLDGEIDAGFRSGKNTADAASLKKLRNEMVDIVDARVPAYRQARQVYSSDSEILEAVELGRKALNMGDGQLAVTLKGMRGAEREAFRKAALDALGDKLNTGEGAKVINDLIGSERARRNLKLIVGDAKQYAELTKRLLAEQQIRKTGGRVNPSVGSATAMRQGDAGALPDTMALGHSAATGNWWAFANQALNAVRMRGQGLTDKSKGQMAAGLMTDDRAAQAAYLQQLEAAEKRLRDQQARKGFLGASAYGGATAGLLSN